MAEMFRQRIAQAEAMARAGDLPGFQSEVLISYLFVLDFSAPKKRIETF